MVVVERRARLVPPEGMRPEDYKVVNTLFEEEVRPDGEGEFCVPIRDKGVTVSFGIPEEEDDGRVFLSTDVVLEGGASKVVAEEGRMDYLSTAQSLVFMSPHFASLKSKNAEEAMRYIEEDPKVAELAEVLRRVYSRRKDPYNDPEYKQAYKEAIVSVLERLPEHLVKDLRKSSKPALMKVGKVVQSEEGLRRQIYYIDSEVTSVGGSDRYWILPPEGRMGNPVDWVLHLADISDIYETFPEGEREIQDPDKTDQFRIFPRSGKGESMAFISSESYMTTFDWFGNLFSKGWEGVTGFLADVTGTKGIATIDNTLRVPRGREGVYIVRAFSGVFYDVRGTGENELIGELPDGTRDWLIAFTINAVMGAADCAGAMVGQGELLGGDGDVKAVLRKAIKGSLKKAFEVATKRAPRGVKSFLSAESFTKAFFDVLYSFTADFVCTFLGDIPGILEEGLEAKSKAEAERISKRIKSIRTMLKGAKVGLKMIGGAIDIGYKVAMFGSAGERAVTLATGWHPLVNVTPLETWIVVIGDPFSPRITSLSSWRGSFGTTITITGERFAKAPKDNRVYFGGKEAEVISGNSKELKVKVPRLPSGSEVYILIETPWGSVISDRKFKILRSPYITKIDPTEGYPQRSQPFVLKGDIKFYGTKIAVYGEDLAFKSNDKVAFNGRLSKTETDTETDAEFYYVGHVIDVPGEVVKGKGYKGKEVYVSVIANIEGQRYESNKVPFLILGSPVLEEVIPPVIGEEQERITLKGKNFPKALWMNVYFRYKDAESGSTRVDTSDVRELLWHNHGLVTVRLPEGIPDTAKVEVWVETPAGETEKKELVKVKGVQRVAEEETEEIEEGYTIYVTCTNKDTAEARKPDGKLTFTEAVAIANGDIDPFSPPWDDTDIREYVHYYEEDSRWVEKDTTVVKDKKGHSGKETKYVYKVMHYKSGDVDTVLDEEVDLDRSDLEEGDYVEGEHGGEDYRDMIRSKTKVIDGGATLAELRLNMDRIRCRTLTLKGMPLILQDRCELEIDTLKGRGIVIEGQGNKVTYWIKGLGTVFKDVEGEAIVLEEDSGGNEIFVRGIYCTGTGIHIEGHANRVVGRKMTLHTKGDGICISGGQYNTVILELKGAKLDEESVHSVGGTAVNILEAQGNYIELSGGDLVGNRGVSLTNARKNEIRLMNGSWKVRGDYGISVDGGAGNIIDAGSYFHLELLQGTGVKLNNTEGNYFKKNLDIRGGKVGIHICKGKNNYFEHYSLSSEIRNTLKEGIIISDGAKANVLKGVLIDTCGADGILISGPETEGNEIVAFRVSHCLGNGIRITDGAHHNKIIHGYYSEAFIEGNMENGILVENSDHNLIYGFHYNYYGKEIYSGRIADNMTGVRIIGSVGTVLKFIRIGYNRYAGMWLSGVTSDKFPSAEVKALVKFEREDQLGGEVGVILDDGTRNVSLDVDISGFKAGLIMSGNARFNKVHADNIGDFSQIGIKMAEGANFNTLVIKWLGGSGMAILLEGVEHDSVKCYISGVKGNGIVLRNSSHNTIKADVYRCSGDGFVLYGSSDNIFRNGQAMFNKGRGVVVKGGEGNSFLNFTVEQNSGGGMLIEGASKIRIKDSEVSWNELYGLWLKGARDCLLYTSPSPRD